LLSIFIFICKRGGWVLVKYFNDIKKLDIRMDVVNLSNVDKVGFKKTRGIIANV
jgi:hypothetical protein